MTYEDPIERDMVIASPYGACYVALVPNAPSGVPQGERDISF